MVSVESKDKNLTTRDAAALATGAPSSIYLVVVVVEGDLVLLKELLEVGGDVPHPELVPPLLLVTGVLLVHLHTGVSGPSCSTWYLAVGPSTWGV